jgi:4-diphosphocytidyl-2-C-methyl-D-erythritol kinase
VRREAAPGGRDNLVWRAAESLWRAIGRRGEPHGIRLVLEKGIPMAAGLGGGSADAAAALAGLNVVWRGRLPRRDLLELAGELGSDVPFFLIGGAALGLGRGEDVYPLADGRRTGLVVIKPSIGISTVEAYRWFDEDAGRRPASASLVEADGVDMDWPTGPVELRNDLQPAVCRRHPGITAAIDALRGAGATAAAMSGSGSAVFGVFTEAGAARAARRLARPGWQVMAVRTLSRRETGRRMALC